MKIDTLVQGSYQTNTYVLRSAEDDKKCVIIDTGLDNLALMDFLKENELSPEALILTHGHLDHIHGIPELRQAYPQMKVCIHEQDDIMLTDPIRNMSGLSAIYEDFSIEPADTLLKEGQIIEFAGLSFKVLHVPGHTPGGICLYDEAEKVVFSGDVVFAGSVGRTDFPGYQQGKCHEQLINGIKEKLMVLPEETKLYPGHGPATTVRNEKKHNPFLNGSCFF